MNYFITLIFLLLSSSANAISHSDIIWFGILLFMCIYALVKKRIHAIDLKLLGVLLLVYLVYVVLRNLLVTGLSFEYLQSDLIFPFKYIVLSFIYCVILRDKAPKYIVNVIVHLTIISFFFYFFQLVGFADVIYNFSESLGLPHANTIPGYTNFIIFTFTKDLHDFRNSGFVWEPGAFGCFLIIALLLHFFRNKFVFDKKAIILIIGVVTTLSTTNYLALIILLFLAYRYRVPKLNMYVLLMIPVFIILVITIPFLGDKIAHIYIDDMKGLENLKKISKYHRDEQIPLNRFASMVYLYDALGPNLILGLSNKYDDYINKVYNLNISNGIFDFFAKFGIFGFIFLVWDYVKFCAIYLAKNEYLIYCVLILLVISFGEPILFLPIILLFLFLPTLIKADENPANKYDLPNLAA